MKTLSALGLLVTGLFAWGQVSIAHDPLNVALKAQAVGARAQPQLHVGQLGQPNTNR